MKFGVQLTDRSTTCRARFWRIAALAKAGITEINPA